MVRWLGFELSRRVLELDVLQLVVMIFSVTREQWLVQKATHILEGFWPLRLPVQKDDLQFHTLLKSMSAEVCRMESPAVQIFGFQLWIHIRQFMGSACMLQILLGQTFRNDPLPSPM